VGFPVSLQYTLFDYDNLTAKHLIDIGAVHFRPDDPFRFTSGRLSPIYVDVRLVCGVPSVRANIARMAFAKIWETIGIDEIQYYAGGETAGIPFAAWMADRAERPMCYIRKKPKGFGRCAQIEGLTEEQLSLGNKFLLVEDLCSDGGSKLGFIQAIRHSGNVVDHCMVVYSYGCFGADEALAKEGVRLHSLTTGETLVNVAEDLGIYPEETIAEVRAFLRDPDGYAEQYGSV
jgi:orotate phosphoribosyltransferase